MYRDSEKTKAELERIEPGSSRAFDAFIAETARIYDIVRPLMNNCYTKIALINPRYWSNLPAGEVFTAPARVDGTFVCDATVGDYFGPKFGDLSPTPMVLRIENGRLVDAECARPEVQREFWAYCHTDDNIDRIGELAFGTNLGVSDMIGVLLQDEKVPGVQVAFGDPYFAVA